MDRVTCPHVKRDGTICGKICTCTIGCAKHWTLYKEIVEKIPCIVCGKPGPRKTHIDVTFRFA